MLALVLAGEAVFFLPFVLPRVFRPTLLDVFGLTNLQLGLAFSAYGVVAMLAYLPSGPLADRYCPRKLMAFALLGTAAGGLLLRFDLGAAQLRLLYAFWGLSTILLFWSALMRATRAWGRGQVPGTAFGLLDSGRGLVAAALATSSVALFDWLMPAAGSVASMKGRRAAFIGVIDLFTLVTAFAAALTWWLVPDDAGAETVSKRPQSQFRLNDFLTVVGMPAVWLQAVIVVCAYVGYKSLDDVSLYAKEVLGMDETSAAGVASMVLWVRVPSAIIAGVIADRWRIVPTTTCCFLLIGLGSTAIASGLLHGGWMLWFYATILGTSGAVFALRGLYFAIMKEGRVPFRVTGTTVGVVSAIGFLPDVFFGPLMGKLLDRSPGLLGHQHVFGVVAAFSLVGLVASLSFKFAGRRATTEP